MTLLQKQRIDEMRKHGESYTKIAASLGLSENTIKSYCRRNLLKIDTCPQCGKPLVHIPHKRNKKFCSDKCRMAWWKAHPEALNRKAIYNFACLQCGTVFQAYGNAKRKFCSRSCYGQASARRWRDE